MRFDGLDLNLLVALDILIDERNVSTAADRLCLSQSAMSSALKRLRDYFEDDLLVTCGRRMVLTSRAEDLAAPVRNALLQIRSNVTRPQSFEPAVSERRFSIMLSDYMREVVLAPFLRGLAATAPKLRFELWTPGDHPAEAIETGEVDLMINIDRYVSQHHPARLLLEDDYVVVADADHPDLVDGIDRDLFLGLDHVSISFGRLKEPTWCDRMIEEQAGGVRRIAVSVSSFVAVPDFVIGTRRVATMHRRLATLLAASLPLRIHEHPLALPGIKEMVQWNSFSHRDPGLRWLIDTLIGFALGADVPERLSAE